MGTYKRLPRGKKKPADDIATFVERAYAWAHRQWRLIGLAFVLGAVLFVAAVGLHKYTGWKAARAASALADAERIEAADERADALVHIAQKYPRVGAGLAAAVMLGNESLSAEKLDDALRWYEFLRDRARPQPITRVFALHAAGLVRERQGAWEEAAIDYRQAANVKGNVIRAISIYGEARCREHLGQYEQARELYRKAIDAAGDIDAGTAAKSEERLLWLISHDAARG